MEVGIVALIIGWLIALLWIMAFIIGDNFFEGTEFETFMSDYCLAGASLPVILGIIIFLTSLLVQVRR